MIGNSTLNVLKQGAGVIVALQQDSKSPNYLQTTKLVFFSVSLDMRIKLTQTVLNLGECSVPDRTAEGSAAQYDSFKWDTITGSARGFTEG